MMSRDLEMFEQMSSGELSNREMRKFFGEDPCTPASKSRVIKRLGVLIKSGYVQSRRYYRRDNKGFFVLNALTRKAVVALVNNGIPIDHIRTPYLPSDMMLRHERTVSRVVRTIKLEAGEKSVLFRFWDEISLRKNRGTRDRGKPIPDLRVELYLEDISLGVSFDIEVDLGTEQTIFFVRKKICRAKPTLVLCNSQVRIEQLRSLCRIYDHEMVVFAPLEEFYVHGIFDTSWETIEQQRKKALEYFSFTNT